MKLNEYEERQKMIDKQRIRFDICSLIILKPVVQSWSMDQGSPGDEKIPSYAWIAGCIFRNKISGYSENPSKAIYFRMVFP